MNASRTIRSLVVALAVVGVAQVEPTGASAIGGGGPVPEARDLLGAIDFVPAREAFDEVMGPTSLQQLIGLATDDGEDPGVRLRALRALSHFPESDEARGTLTAMVDELSIWGSGTPALLLRAALESLGEIGGAAAVPEITPLLNNPSRDVRATAADALGEIGSTNANDPLEDRNEIETVPQVQLAISEALRKIRAASGG